MSRLPINLFLKQFSLGLYALRPNPTALKSPVALNVCTS